MAYDDSLPPRLLGTAPAAGVAAGAPGNFTPWNARRPADLAALQALGALGQAAAWTPGQSVGLRDGSRAHWDGDSWAAGPAPAPMGAAADSGNDAASAQVSAASAPEAFAGTVPDGTVDLPVALGAPGESGTVEADPDSPVPGVPGVVVTPDGVEHVGTLPASAALPDLLTVIAGTPGSYVPDLKAADRPRNVTELRTRATATLAAEPWAAGQYVLVGENGKRAYWDGETWQRGEAPA